MKNVMKLALLASVISVMTTDISMASSKDDNPLVATSSISKGKWQRFKDWLTSACVCGSKTIEEADKVAHQLQGTAQVALTTASNLKPVLNVVLNEEQQKKVDSALSTAQGTLNQVQTQVQSVTDQVRQVQSQLQQQATTAIDAGQKLESQVSADLSKAKADATNAGQALVAQVSEDISKAKASVTSTGNALVTQVSEDLNKAKAVVTTAVSNQV